MSDRKEKKSVTEMSDEELDELTKDFIRKREEESGNPPDFETLVAERLRRISKGVEPISRIDERTQQYLPKISPVKSDTTRIVVILGILTSFVIGAGLYLITAF